ncbi:MAG: hypothetical protein JXA46_15125 [Dehalococcoidales bacterium]|nr:hypothetical protein [Dehalococcoidales bacterium]
MKKNLGIVLAFCVFVLMITWIVGCTCAKNGKDNAIPINLQNAKNVGSIYLTVSYDPEVIEIKEVTPGELVKDAMLDYNFDQPGSVVIGIINTGGISGDGAIVALYFEIIDENGSSAINLDSVEMCDVNSLVDIRYQVSGGNVMAKDSGITPPVVICVD